MFARTDTASVAQVRLAATKLILALVLVGFCLVGARNALWPIVTWPMYSKRTPKVPPAFITATHLRVADAKGTHYRLMPRELMPAPRDGAAKKLVRESFSAGRDHRAQRAYLVFLVERALGVEVDTIAAVDRTWRVRPYANPPLDPSIAVHEVVRGQFSPRLTGRGSTPWPDSRL